MLSSLPSPWRTASGWLLALLLVEAGPAAAQAPAWQTAQTFNPVLPASAFGYPPRITATATDAAGNLYVAGSFADALVLGTTTLTSAGGDDAFVAKLAPGGTQVVWAYRAGGQGSDAAEALLVSGTAVYIAGTFSASTASFGNVALTGAANQNAYVAKLTDAGPTASFVWAQRVGGADDMYVQTAALSGTSLYIGGSYKGVTGDFGPLSLANTSQPTYLFDGYVVKLTDAGTTASPVWVRGVGGTGSEGITALAASGPNVYATGSSDSPVAFVGATALPNAGREDTFVAKLADAGASASFAWVQGLGGVGYDVAGAVEVRGTSVYVLGAFESPTLGFGSLSLTNAGVSDGFVAKLTDAGAGASWAWAQRMGGPGNDGATALAVSGTSVFVAGGFSGTAGFGSTSLTSAGAIDAFVTKLTDAGPTAAFAWAQRAGGANDDVASKVALGGTSVYATGFLKSAAAAFGSTTLTNAYAPYRMGFLASLADATLAATPAARPRAAAVIYPNPAHLTATVRLPMSSTGGLTLTHALGGVVRRYPAPAAGVLEMPLDLRGLPAGLYVLQGPGGNQRLVVE